MVIVGAHGYCYHLLLVLFLLYVIQTFNGYYYCFNTYTNKFDININCNIIFNVGNYKYLLNVS